MFIDDMVSLMVDEGLVLGTNLFATQRANVPTLASGFATLQIIENSVASPERNNNNVVTPAYVQVGCQFSTRASTPAAARIMAYRAYYRTVGIRHAWIINQNVTLSGWYRELTPLQEPFEVPTGDRGEARFVFSIRGLRKPEPASVTNIAPYPAWVQAGWMQ